MVTRAPAIAVALAALLAVGSAPVSARTSPDGAEFCYDVSLTSRLDAPRDPSKISVQNFIIDGKCRVVAVGPAEEVSSGELAPSSVGTASDVIGIVGASQAATGPVSLASTSYRTNAGLRVFDCCGILLTEYWMENTWTSTGSTGVITAWGAVDGASWHREAGNTGGWSLDTASHQLGLVAGGLNQTFEKVRGSQGFNYQGVFDPTGTLFYNRLTLYPQGNRSGTFSCVFDYYLKKVPAGPLAWPAPQTICGRGFYPYR